VTYDLGTNTIFLEDGTNTLVSIYNEIVTTQVVIPAKALDKTIQDRQDRPESRKAL